MLLKSRFNYICCVKMKIIRFTSCLLDFSLSLYATTIALVNESQIFGYEE